MSHGLELSRVARSSRMSSCWLAVAAVSDVFFAQDSSVLLAAEKHAAAHDDVVGLDSANCGRTYEQAGKNGRVS